MTNIEERQHEMKSLRNYIVRDEAAALSEQYPPDEIAYLERRIRNNQARLAEIERDE